MSYYHYSKETFIKRKIAENQLKTIAPNLEDRPAIYTWYRYAEVKCYIGQAKGGRLKERSIEHILAFDHLGNSIRTHKLYSKDNPLGWRLKIEYCSEEDLNRLEREKIAQAQEKGYSLYNITSGGQNEGKVDINERKQRKGYANGREHGYKNGLEEGTKKGFKSGLEEGKKVGYQNAMREIKELFDKYLKVLPKDNDLKKDGTIKEIYLRKLKEFNELLANVDEKE